MRYLTQSFLKSALSRGKVVEQFIGSVTRDELAGLRFLQLSVEAGKISITIFDVDDIGSEDFLDIYSFPSLIEDEEYDRPTRTYDDLTEALEDADSSFGANPHRWTNEGLAQDEYQDYLTQN
jgi:hypothetical protein